MTSFERLAQESVNVLAITDGKVKRNTAPESAAASMDAGVSFADTLNGFSADTAEAQPAVPDKWTDKIAGYAAAVLNVNDYLKNELCIDTSKRVPTHGITSEQKEWLASRHDLGAIGNGGDTREFGEFIGDLVYLNVLSAGDAADLMQPGLPIDPANPNSLTYMGENYCDFSEKGGILWLIERRLEAQKRELKHMEDEAAYPYRTKEDLEYIRRLREFLNNKEECYELISRVLGDTGISGGESHGRGGVQDVSSQLKEDFGAVLAR